MQGVLERVQLRGGTARGLIPGIGRIAVAI